MLIYEIILKKLVSIFCFLYTSFLPGYYMMLFGDGLGLLLRASPRGFLFPTRKPSREASRPSVSGQCMNCSGTNQDPDVPTFFFSYVLHHYEKEVHLWVTLRLFGYRTRKGAFGRTRTPISAYAMFFVILKYIMFSQK